MYIWRWINTLSPYFTVFLWEYARKSSGLSGALPYTLTQHVAKNGRLATKLVSLQRRTDWNVLYNDSKPDIRKCTLGQCIWQAIWNHSRQFQFRSLSIMGRYSARQQVTIIMICPIESVYSLDLPLSLGGMGIIGSVTQKDVIARSAQCSTLLSELLSAPPIA